METPRLLDKMPCVWTILVVFMGSEGFDWNYYVDCELYWRKWGELNRNQRDGTGSSLCPRYRDYHHRWLRFDVQKELIIVK